MKAMKDIYWWRMYGPFDAGEDDLPRTGQVISHYARLSGLKASDLARRLTQLGWSVGERRVEQLQAQTNLSDPQQISRRRLLAQVLAIPPVLLGISHVAHVADEVDPAARQHGGVITPAHVDADAIARYEGVLETYWDSFYSSSVQRHAESIECWCAHFTELSRSCRSVERPHVLTLLCRFEQLAAVAARDRADHAAALRHHDASVAVAQELGNAELLAASLFRRAKTKAQQRQVAVAVEDVKVALPYARRSRDQLRGYISQMAADLISQLPTTPERTATYHRFMDETGRILRKRPLEDDGSFARLTMAGYQQDRARGFLRLGDHEAAIEAIGLAEKVQSPDMTRWQALAQSGEVEWACNEIEEALRLVRATQSSAKRRKLRAVLGAMAERYPGDPHVRHTAALLASERAGG
jgi:hypothetical protein